MFFFWTLKVQTRRTERSRGHSKYKYPVRNYPFVYFPVRGAGSLIFVILVLCILQMMAIPCVLMGCCNPAVTQSWRKRFVRILWHSIKVDATSALYRWKLRIYHQYVHISYIMCIYIYYTIYIYSQLGKQRAFKLSTADTLWVKLGEGWTEKLHSANPTQRWPNDNWFVNVSKPSLYVLYGWWLIRP